MFITCLLNWPRVEGMLLQYIKPHYLHSKVTMSLLNMLNNNCFFKCDVWVHKTSCKESSHLLGHKQANRYLDSFSSHWNSAGQCRVYSPDNRYLSQVCNRNTFQVRHCLMQHRKLICSFLYCGQMGGIMDFSRDKPFVTLYKNMGKK